MILIVLGTHELPFERLLREMDRQILVGNVKEEVLVQAGHTKYQSEHMEIFDFTTYENMEKLYREASFIITHGGTGSITMGVKLGKKVIAVPRLIKYDEHNDDHQLEIVKQFQETGHILSWDDSTSLADVIRHVENFEPVPFISGNGQILSIIKNFIDKEG